MGFLERANAISTAVHCLFGLFCILYILCDYFPLNNNVQIVCMFSVLLLTPVVIYFHYMCKDYEYSLSDLHFWLMIVVTLMIVFSPYIGYIMTWM